MYFSPARALRRRLLLGVPALVMAVAAPALTSGVARAGTAAPGAPSAAHPTRSWQPWFSDDFNGSSLNRDNWCVYNGHGGQHGPRSASNVHVSGGVLTLVTRQIAGRWYGAGVCAARATRLTFGRYQIRVRMDRAYGVRGTALLWPVYGWPPEIDFYELESTDQARTRNMLSNHYGSTNLMQHAFVSGDYSGWHVVGVDWTPTAIRYTLDGQVVATMTGHVPHEPMWLALQTGTGQRTHAPNASTPDNVKMQVDWVHVYRLQ